MFENRCIFRLHAISVYISKIYAFQLHTITFDKLSHPVFAHRTLKNFFDEVFHYINDRKNVSINQTIDLNDQGFFLDMRETNMSFIFGLIIWGRFFSKPSAKSIFHNPKFSRNAPYIGHFLKSQ